MIGYVMLAGFALFIASLCAHMAWTGRVTFGRRTLLNRHEDPLGFWVVWTIFVGSAVFAYAKFAITVASFPGGPLADDGWWCEAIGCVVKDMAQRRAVGWRHTPHAASGISFGGLFSAIVGATAVMAFLGCSLWLLIVLVAGLWHWVRTAHTGISASDFHRQRILVSLKWFGASLLVVVVSFASTIVAGRLRG